MSGIEYNSTDLEKAEFQDSDDWQDSILNQEDKEELMDSFQTDMNRNKIRHHLIESQGFKCWESTNGVHFKTTKYEKRVDHTHAYLKKCACNDKLFIYVNTYESTEHGNSITVEMCHTADNKDWLDLKIYSIDPEDFDSAVKISHYINKLLKLWKVYTNE